MAGNNGSQDWAKRPATISFLASAISGIAAVVLTVLGIQLWVDNRVDVILDARLTPIEFRMQALEKRLERQQANPADLIIPVREMNSESE